MNRNPSEMSSDTDRDTGNVTCQGEDSDTEYPLVFQCTKCNSILGDSLSWLCANEDLRSLTLSHVTPDVCVQEKLLTSPVGCDQGSTYSTLSCARCDAVVGKLYKTTPKSLDALRDFFTLFVSKLDSYQVGSAGQETEEGSGHSLPTQLGQLPKGTIAEAIRKIQVVVLELSQRMTAIEGMLSTKNDGDLAGDLPIQISASKGNTVNEHSGDDEHVYANGYSNMSRNNSIICERSLDRNHNESQLPSSKRKRAK